MLCELGVVCGRLHACVYKSVSSQVTAVLCFVQLEAPELSDKEESFEVVVAVVADPELDPCSDSSLPKAVILDLSPVNFLDTVGVKTLCDVSVLNLLSNNQLMKLHDF